VSISVSTDSCAPETDNKNYDFSNNSNHDNSNYEHEQDNNNYNDNDDYNHNHHDNHNVHENHRVLDGDADHNYHTNAASSAKRYKHDSKHIASTESIGSNDMNTDAKQSTQSDALLANANANASEYTKVLWSNEVEQIEMLQLSLVEAFFLQYSLGVLDIYRIADQSQSTSQNSSQNQNQIESTSTSLFNQSSSSSSPPPPPPSSSSSSLLTDLKKGSVKLSYMTVQETWNLFKSINSRFVTLMAGYHYLRSKGWMPKSGIKYGADFVIYQLSPEYLHARYAVVCKSVTETLDATDKHSQRDRSWRAVQSHIRITSHVAKDLMMLDVIHPFARPMDATTLGMTYASVEDQCKKKEELSMKCNKTFRQSSKSSTASTLSSSLSSSATSTSISTSLTDPAIGWVDSASAPMIGSFPAWIFCNPPIIKKSQKPTRTPALTSSAATHLCSSSSSNMSSPTVTPTVTPNLPLDATPAYLQSLKIHAHVLQKFSALAQRIGSTNSNGNDMSK
jgi:tRNA splicing endonuclease